jgi:branched-chain amino acid transport system substrate-binding protein
MPHGAPVALLDRILPVVVILATACGSGELIPIGVAGAFSDPIGRPMMLGARMAVDEINATGGIDGRKLVLIEENDFGEPDSAIVVANRLYASDAVAVIGHLYSGTTLAAAPVYNGGADPLVSISPSSSAPEVSQAGHYTFRVCPSDLAHGAALARWVRERLGLSRGTVLYLNDEYGRGVRERFVAEFERRGGEVIAIAPYLGDTPDVAAYMARMQQDGRSQFVVVAGNRSEAEEVLREMQARQMSLPLLGADGLEGIEEAGGLAEGVYETLAYLALIDTPANQKFVAAYRARYAAEMPPNQPAAASYDAIYLLRDVIRRAGTDRTRIRDALAAVGVDAPFEGVTGRIAFDSLGDVPTRDVHVAVVRNGALRLAGGQ